MSQPPNHDPNAPFDDLDGQTGLSARARELLGDRRALAAIGVALVAVIALCAFVVVPALSGSSSSDSTAIARGVPRGTPAASATSSAAASAPPTTSGPLTIRDPFSPLYVPAAAASAVPSAPATTAPATSTPQPTAPSVVTVTPVPTTAPTQSKVVLTQLVLDKLTWSGKAATSTANVTVNGLPYTAQLGKAFGKGFTMTAITSGNATFSYGGQTVTLVVGEFGLFAGAS